MKGGRPHGWRGVMPTAGGRQCRGAACCETGSPSPRLSLKGIAPGLVSPPRQGYLLWGRTRAKTLRGHLAPIPKRRAQATPAGDKLSPDPSHFMRCTDGRSALALMLARSDFSQSHCSWRARTCLALSCKTRSLCGQTIRARICLPGTCARWAPVPPSRVALSARVHANHRRNTPNS